MIGTKSLKTESDKSLWGGGSGEHLSSERGSPADYVIIGGGAAGLFAAARLSERGANVTLLERNDKCGKKLSITGKGRCNLTNNCTRDEFFENVVTNPKFLYSAYGGFTSGDAMDYFEKLGVPLKTERGRRVFPVSDKAADVVNALINACKKNGVIFKRYDVKKIITKNETAIGGGAAPAGNINGIQAIGVTDGKTDIFAEKIIIATGGKSYPGTGSDGSGYRLLSELGIKINQPQASLVPIICAEKYCREMRGLSLRNVNLSATENGKTVFSEQGEMMFTDFGITGPLVLSASAHIKNIAAAKLSIDLKPALDIDTLDRRILRDFSENPNRIVTNSLDKLLPASLRPVMVSLSGIAPEKQVNAVTKDERGRLLTLLKKFPLTPTGFRPIDEAVITRGGIDVREINPKTMEAKTIKNLFFAGEIIDVDAYTGGYNLQIAWSTAAAIG
jgi:predicted Rossmann fold flavoprotein